MIKGELLYLLDRENIREYDDERRLKGFLFEWSGSYFAILKGKIPLPLANMINSDFNERTSIRVHGNRDRKKPICFATHPILDRQARALTNELVNSNTMDKKEFDNWYINEKDRFSREYPKEMYVTLYHIDTIEGVKHAIDCIRKYGVNNEWAIGND